jgi:hypothetical protein
MLIIMLVVLAAACLLATLLVSPESGGDGGFELPPAVLQILTRPAGPTILALILAPLSLPIVALSLDAVSAPPDAYLATPARLAEADPSRWISAVGCVLVAALVAGTAGGVLVRRHARVGAILTFLLAWEMAIVALPVLPALLHLDVGFAYVCLDGCGVAIESGNPVGALQLAVMPWAVLMSPFFAPIPFVTLLGGIFVWTKMLRYSPGLDVTPFRRPA